MQINFSSSLSLDDFSSQNEDHEPEFGTNVNNCGGAGLGASEDVKKIMKPRFLNFIIWEKVGCNQD